MEESLQSIWECDDELPDFLDDPPLPPPAPPLSLLEDGEIASASGALQPDGSFCFAANDLDAAIKSAKKSKKEKKTKRKKHRRQKFRPSNVQEIDPKRTFVSRTIRLLKEPKGYLIEAAVERLGIDVVRELVHEVQTIEENGGQTTLSGKRRRTPGGVLWNVLRSRHEEDYKAIMAAGKNFEKQLKCKVESDGLKRKVESDGMVIDGQPSRKRRKTGAIGSFTGPAAQVKRTRVTLWPSRCKNIEDIHCKVDPDNSRTLTQVQIAWAAGVKQSDNYKPGLNDVEMYDDGVKKKPTSLAERLRVPIHYDDLLEI